MDFETWVESKGFALSDLNDTQVGALRAAWRAEQNPTPEPSKDPDPKRGDPIELDSIMEAFRAEEARQRRITSMVGEALEENPNRADELEHIGKKAINDKWSETQTELVILRTCRASAPAPLRVGGSGPLLNEKIIEAAVAQASRLSSVEKAYDERTLEAAHKAFRGGMGLQQLLLVVAQQNGYRSSAPVKSNLREVLQFAFNPKSSGVSSISVSGILSNLANKFLRDAFMSVEQEWSKIAARRSFTDFKQTSTYSLSGDLTYEEIAPGGQIKHGTLGETTYNNQARSYGKMLGLDRRDIVNDDLNAFSRIGQRLGRGGALKLNVVFWTEFLDNASFFSTGNANLITGATSLLSGSTGIGALTLAETAFRLLKDPDGNLMGAMPKILLVTAALRAYARDLMDSTKKVATTTANQGMPDGNPFAGMFEVVSSAYLQDTTISGNSATQWYLLADPNDVPVIEVGFLNGQEMPTVESADADFNQLGVQFRGYHDFGVAKQEFRGGVRSNGA